MAPGVSYPNFPVSLLLFSNLFTIVIFKIKQDQSSACKETFPSLCRKMSFYHRGFDESIIKELLAFVKHKEKIFGTDLFKINKTYIESIDRTFYYRNFEMERVGMYKS